MYAPKTQETTVGVTVTTGRLDGMISTLQTPDSKVSVATTARRVGRILLVSLALSSGACAGYARPAAPAPAYRERTPTAEEIGQVDVRTALDAVRLLRPDFLTWNRGVLTASPHFAR